MITVVSYLGTLPEKQIRSVPLAPKIQTLHLYAQGVNAVGDTGIVTDKMIWQPAKVAVILGWVHEHSKAASHLKFRREIVDRQLASGGRTVIADSNLFLYKNTQNPGYWLRYSFDGIFPDSGEYCDSNPDTQRVKLVSQQLGLQLQPWRTTGSFILLCLQRNGGWSMSGTSTIDWAMTTIKELRAYTTRPIVIRPHPGDRQGPRIVKDIMIRCQRKNIKRVSNSRNTELMADLQDCWAMINHNSSPGIAAAIEGVPVFVTDPQRSQARDIANTDLAMIENPNMPDRWPWLQRLCQFHWSHEEIRNGQCWQHMRQWV